MRFGSKLALPQYGAQHKQTNSGTAVKTNLTARNKVQRLLLMLSSINKSGAAVKVSPTETENSRCDSVYDPRARPRCDVRLRRLLADLDADIDP